MNGRALADGAFDPAEDFMIPGRDLLGRFVFVLGRRWRNDERDVRRVVERQLSKVAQNEVRAVEDAQLHVERTRRMCRQLSGAEAKSEESGSSLRLTAIRFDPPPLAAHSSTFRPPRLNAALGPQ